MFSIRVSAVLTLAALCLPAPPASAFVPPEHHHLGIEPARVLTFDPATQTMHRRSPVWQAFLEGEGKGWTARFDQVTGMPHRMHGPGIELGPLHDKATVERAVMGFIARHADLLGVGDSVPQLASAHYVERMDAWYVDVDTLHDGLPVWRGGITFRIKHDRLTMVGADTYPDTPRLNALELTAEQAITAHIEHGPAPAAKHRELETEAMILPWEEAGKVTLRVVWRVASKTHQPMGHWVGFVDATTGELLNVRDTIRYFDGALTAQHDVRSGDGQLTTSPLPFAEVSGGGQSTYTDASGNFSLPDASSYRVSLDAQRVRLFDEAGQIEPNISPSDTQLTASDFGDRYAPLTTYVYTHRAQDWAVSIAPEVSYSDAQIRAYVNLSGNCNAYFDGNINFLQRGGGCNNTGRLADVIMHEWGHGFHTYSILSGYYDGSLGEGAADTVAFILTDDSRVAPYFFTGGGTLRNVDNNNRYPRDYVANEQYIHTNGLIFGGSMWDTRESLRRTLGEPAATEVLSDIFAGALKGGPSVETAYDEALFADDDDGDLGNGTPHLCALIEGFGAHGLGPASGGVGVAIDHTPIVSADAIAPVKVRADVASPAPQCVELAQTTGKVHYQINGDGWQEAPMSHIAGGVEGDIPGAALGDVVEYWIELTDESGNTYTEPSGGIIRPYTYYVGGALEVGCTDFEDGDGGFTGRLLAGENSDGANDWIWGTPMGQGGDPSSAASGSKIWGNDLGEDGWNGEYQNEKHTRLESREYNTYHYQDAFLNYSRWLTIEDGYYDQASILADGDVVWTNWGTDQNRGTDHHIDNSWTSHSVELFGQADDGKLTLAFDLISDGGLTFGGWNIDDVCIFAPATADNRLGISDFTATLADDRGAVALSWTYPKHAPVERVRLVRKFGSFPTGPEDGDTIWEATGIELGAQAEIIDSLDPGELISHYAVYPSDGEAWLSWTLEGYNADAPDGAPSTPPGSDGNGVGTDNGGEGEKAGCGCASSQRALGPWVLLLGLAGLRRRRANA